MENKILINFIKENKEIELNYDQPDLRQLVTTIISEHLEVNASNIIISTGIENFDAQEFKEILISVHEDFEQEIDKFFENIKQEIKTYYDIDGVTEEVLCRIKVDGDSVNVD